MKILVIGSGGREHALIWKIAKSKRVDKIYCAPGNGGTRLQAENVPIGVTDYDGILDFALRTGIDFTVVGPEVPLIDGIVDRFRARGLRIFGPTAAGARLEGSKIYAKETMATVGVPTGPFFPFDDVDRALAWLRDQPADHPWVVKADGNALGKGVLMCDDRDQSMSAVMRMMVEREFGPAGDRVCIEERLYGYEVSLLAICCGTDALPLAPVVDFKRRFEDDKGPNTGSMGGYSPVPSFYPEFVDFCKAKIFAPILHKVEYSGVLYAGLMVTPDGPKVLEFNTRFGDPEAQVMLPRLESDLLDLLEAAVDGRLKDMTARWSPKYSVTVVGVSDGYPGDYGRGFVIYGMDEAESMPDSHIFHAGTKWVEGTGLVTDGGRVVNATGLGYSYPAAAKRAYAALRKICWSGMGFRTDIASGV